MQDQYFHRQLHHFASCHYLHGISPRAQAVNIPKDPLAVQEIQVWSVGRENTLEEEMATHSSILAWEIPWTEDPGGLQSLGSQRVEHNLATEHKPGITLCFRYLKSDWAYVIYLVMKFFLQKSISGLIICYISGSCCCCLVALCVQLFATPWTAAHQGSLSLTISCQNLPSSCPMHRWCHPTISSSDVLFSYPQSFPASVIFPMSHLFVSDDQNTGTSALASVLPMSIQGRFPLRFTGLVSLLSKGHSGVFSSTTV